MAKNVWEIPIDANTSLEDLELCAQSADRSSDPNIQKSAARAKAELARRDKTEWAERFAAQEHARVQAQRFQEAQNKLLIAAQRELVEKQIQVAERQVEAAEKQSTAAQMSASAAGRTAWATWWLFAATIALVVFAAIQTFGRQ